MLTFPDVILVHARAPKIHIHIYLDTAMPHPSLDLRLQRYTILVPILGMQPQPKYHSARQANQIPALRGVLCAKQMLACKE